MIIFCTAVKVVVVEFIQGSLISILVDIHRFIVLVGHCLSRFRLRSHDAGTF